MKRHLFLVGCIIILILAVVTWEDSSNILSSSENLVSEVKVQNKKTALLFVGDIMLGRNVENLMKKYGQEYPFLRINNLLTSVDAVVANLEGPIMTSHIRTPSQSLRFSFASTTALFLTEHNIKVVSLANNHTYDYGVENYADTRIFLKAANVLPVGNPFEYNDVYSARLTTHGIPVMFVGFNATNPHFDLDKAVAIVRQSKKEPSEFLVVLVHGGDEYVLHSNARQKKIYREIIDAGADAVIAHHPHVVQEIELYKTKPIFYSLGNFIFDQYFSKDVQESLAVKLSLSNSEARYELIPLKSIRSQPQQMNAEESKKFLETLAAKSSQNIQENIKQSFVTIAH